MRLSGIQWLRLFRNDRGATSVLVVFMMIVLVTLGAFAITSANVNMIFGRKAVALNTAYYALDGAGEQYVAAVDYALAQAEGWAVEYMRQKGFLSPQYPEIPDAMQSRIWSGFENALNKNNHCQDAFNRVYLYYAYENLKALYSEYPTQILMPFDDGNGIAGLAIEISVQSPDNLDSSLLIALRVASDRFTIDYSAGEIAGSLADHGPRCLIENWSQKQAPFTYDGGLELWDGSMD